LSKVTHAPQVLIERCNRGDRQTWEEFHAQYCGMVTAVLRRMGRSEPQEIEYAFQDVFLQLFNALRNYDLSRSVEAYIPEIARRVRISRLRKLSAGKWGGMNPRLTGLNALDCRNEAGFMSIQAPGDNQETSLIRTQETHLLRKALDSLSEACRQLLGLRYEQELSYKESGITEVKGDILGLPERVIGEIEINVQVEQKDKFFCTI